MSEGYAEQFASRKLFSTEQIALASFLGAPISGCLLVAQNFRGLGKAGSEWQPLVLGVAATILLMVLALFLPDGFPNFVLPAGSSLGIYFYAKQQQGDAIDNHLKTGGKKGSWAVLIGVSIGCTIVILILLVAIAITFDIMPPEAAPSRAEPSVASAKISQSWQIESSGADSGRLRLRHNWPRLFLNGADRVIFFQMHSSSWTERRGIPGITHDHWVAPSAILSWGSNEVAKIVQCGEQWSLTFKEGRRKKGGLRFYR